MSSNEIRTFRLENMIKEAVTLALYEQGQQPPAAPANAGPVPPPAPPPPPEQNQPPVPQPQDGTPPDQAQGQPQMTIDSMIERLNVIRGGKSFTDPEVYGQLVTYFKKITPEQNQVIDQYLQDISRIMVNVRTGNTDQAPDQSGAPPAAPPPSGGAQAPISPGAGASPPAPVGGGATPGGM